MSRLSAVEPEPWRLMESLRGHTQVFKYPIHHKPAAVQALSRKGGLSPAAPAVDYKEVTLLKRLLSLAECLGFYEPARDHREFKARPKNHAFVWPSSSPDDPVIFLDFDGVMHRAENGSFERMDLLIRLLDAVPEAMICIASDWRLSMTADDLVGLFPAEIRHRICGVTSDLDNGQPFPREREGLAWARKRSTSRFVALDDNPSLYAPGCDFLILTDRYTGLTDALIATCAARLRGSLVGR